MENLKAVFTLLIDNVLRAVGVVSLVVISGFLLWWWF